MQSRPRPPPPHTLPVRPPGGSFCWSPNMPSNSDLRAFAVARYSHNTSPPGLYSVVTSAGLPFPPLPPSLPCILHHPSLLYFPHRSKIGAVILCTVFPLFIIPFLECNLLKVEILVCFVPCCMYSEGKPLDDNCLLTEWMVIFGNLFLFKNETLKCWLEALCMWWSRLLVFSCWRLPSVCWRVLRCQHPEVHPRGSFLLYGEKSSSFFLGTLGL